MCSSDLTTNNKYAVGGTCLIFAENSSRNVFGFNINTGKWNTITVSTTLPWTVAHSNGNTAMIVNDSLAVFYSAYNGNFATLRFEGQKINFGTKWVGCKENYGFLITDTKIYFFDAEDSQIRSLTYTGVGTSSPGGGINDHGDYFCMNIWNTVTSAHTVVAYSPIKKTISEYTLGPLAVSGGNFVFLDHGFIVSSIAGPPYYGLGYSTYTGNFSIKTSDKLPISLHWSSCDPVSVNKRLCCLFHYRGEIDQDGIAPVDRKSVV